MAKHIACGMKKVKKEADCAGTAAFKAAQSTTMMHSNHTNNSTDGQTRTDGANQMAMVGAMTAMVLVGASTVL